MGRSTQHKKPRHTSFICCWFDPSFGKLSEGVCGQKLFCWHDGIGLRLSITLLNCRSQTEQRCRLHSYSYNILAVCHWTLEGCRSNVYWVGKGLKYKKPEPLLRKRTWPAWCPRKKEKAACRTAIPFYFPPGVPLVSSKLFPTCSLGPAITVFCHPWNWLWGKA